MIMINKINKMIKNKKKDKINKGTTLTVVKNIQLEVYFYFDAEESFFLFGRSIFTNDERNVE